MPDMLTRIQRATALLCAPDGPTLSSEGDAVQLIGEAMQQGAELIVVPVERLDNRFFRLETRLAGEVVQKCVTYRRRLAVLGDISAHLAQSRALRAFVSEANRGTQVWFLGDLQELSERLARAQQKSESARRSEQDGRQ